MSLDLPGIPRLPEFDPGSLVLIVGQRDNFNKRAVTARCRGRAHSDKFDTDENHRRAKFRAEVMNVFGIDDEGFHEWCEQQILDQARLLDNKSSVQLVTPNLVSLSDVAEESTRWFWGPSYFPEGAAIILDSDPGEGKSTLAIDIAARFTRGDAMPPAIAPNNTYSSGDALLVCGEDDLSRTVAPRAKAAGANLDKTHFLRTLSIDDDERIIQFPRDFDILERITVDKRIGFMVIDVLACFVEPGLSMNDDAHMRRLMTPLCNMLERTRATALVLRHLNKKQNTGAMYRGTGSVGIVGAARAAFCIAGHPDEPGTKVFAPVKHNLGPKPAALTYTIEAVGGTSRIVWGGKTDLTANEVLGGQEARGGSKSELAKSIITDILASGSRGSNEVQQACLAAGVSERTYWTARKSLGVLAERSGFDDGQWLLYMPVTDREHQDAF